MMNIKKGSNPVLEGPKTNTTRYKYNQSFKYESKYTNDEETVKQTNT